MSWVHIIYKYYDYSSKFFSIKLIRRGIWLKNNMFIFTFRFSQPVVHNSPNGQISFRKNILTHGDLMRFIYYFIVYTYNNTYIILLYCKG